MSVEKIILKYQEMGVTFILNGDKLGYSAPKGVMDEDARNEIKEHKELIISYLENHDSNVVIDKQDKYQPFKLTDIQLSYLVGRNELYQFSGIGCKIYFEYEFPKIQLNRLEEAWKLVVDNNDMLHAVINPNGTQQILKDYEIPHIAEWNLEKASEDVLNSHRSSTRKRLTEKQYNPDTYPLYDLEITSLTNKTIFHFSLDMLIADFTSMNIIIKELEKYYHGHEMSVKELSYRDVIIYNQNVKSQPHDIKKIIEDERYWKERIPNMPEGPEIPLIEEKGEISIRQFNAYISPKRVRELKSITDKYKVTLSGIILALYAETLSYWSQQKDFCLNITMANRPNIHPEIQNIIGDFTVVDILEISGMTRDETFGNRMEKIQRRLWEDLEHSTFTGVDVLREMTKKKKKEIIIPYIYTSTLGLHKDRKVEARGEERLIYKISQTPQVLIDCQVIEFNDRILVNWDVRENVFPEGLIESAFEKFSELLTAIEIGDLVNSESPVTLPNNMKKIRNMINHSKYEFADYMLHQGFCENVRLHPDKEAVVSNGISYSYKEVGDYAITVQKKIQLSGCIEGDIVAVELEKGIWQIAAVFGVLLAGGVYLPIDMKQPKSRKEKIIEDSNARFIISSKDEAYAGTQSNILVNELSLISGETITSVSVKTNQPAYIIYTSGSTGKPKGVVISHQAAMNTIQDIIKRYNITANDKAIGISNLAFDLSVFDIFGLLTVGGSIVLPSSENSVTEWNKLLEEEQVTVWNTVPAQMQMLVSYMKAEQLTGTDSLRLTMLSGDWIPVRLPKEIHKTFKKSQIVSLGGATEASIWSIVYDVEPERIYEKSIPYGKPLANQSFYILDNNMQECPDWVKGSLFIAGKGLAENYLGDSDLTEKKFIYHEKIEDRLYNTGDCGRYLPNGIIEFMGREDHQIKVRGHRVELGEIESIINLHHDVESSVVVTASQNSDMLGAFIQPSFETTDDILVNDREILTDVLSTKSISFNADLDDYKEWVKASNQTALLDIIKTFLNVGVFSECNKWYSLQEIYILTGVHDNFKPLVCRWLNAIKKEGFITSKNNQYFKSNSNLVPEAADEEWEKWKQLDEKVQYSDVMMQYFKESRDRLLPLLHGELDPVDLFFPQGGFHVALAAYRGNIVSQYVNEAVIKVMHSIAETFTYKYPDKKINILEVGAGVGGVSIDSIQSLSEFPVKYTFTDISHSFLNEAQSRFGEYPWVEYALYDINQDYWNQGLAASSFDIILCNNVLHNANDEQRVLMQFKEMITPNGYVAILDATGTNYVLLTSMEFHNGLNGVEDFRSENNQVFLNKSQWRTVLERVGGQLVTVFPADGDAFEILGQTLFLTQFNSKRKRLSQEVIEGYLKSKLPDYMVPTYIEIMTEFPLTINGKINWKALQERIGEDGPVEIPLGEQPNTELEKSVAEIWKKALKKETIWRNENFYEAGGDSLLVAQVVAKMKEDISEAKSWEWDKLMVALGEAPTIEGICKKLISKQNTEETVKGVETNCMYVLKDDQVCNITRVLVHDGTGTISPYNSIVPYLKEQNGSLMAVICSDTDEYLKYSSQTLIKSLGEKYANALLNTGKTDFEIIGYCMGGLIAIEIAKILLEAGVEVHQVISIDTTPSRRMLDNEFLMERAFGKIIGADIAKVGHSVDYQLLKSAIKKLGQRFGGSVPNEEIINLDGEFLPVGECYKRMAIQSHEERLDKLYDTLIDSDKKLIGYQKMHLDALYKVFCHSFRAVISYEAGIYMGDVKVLSCKNKESSFLPIEETDNEQFWRSVVWGDIKWHSIEGTHLTCLSTPHVKDIVELILE